jgi:hypothetical protein
MTILAKYTFTAPQEWEDKQLETVCDELQELIEQAAEKLGLKVESVL